MRLEYIRDGSMVFNPSQARRLMYRLMIAEVCPIITRVVMNIAFSEFNNSSITTSMCRGTDQSEVNPSSEESSNSKLLEIKTFGLGSRT